MYWYELGLLNFVCVGPNVFESAGGGSFGKVYKGYVGEENYLHQLYCTGSS